mgnify:CR=1 FL=1
MKDKLKFICDGANTRRYHTVPTLMTETVGHHSHGVAMIAHILMREHPLNTYNPLVIDAALLHDLAEHQIGDVPSPSKREFGIADQINALEERLMRSSGFPIPALSTQDERILKLADIAQGALFCVQEMEMGNRKMKAVFDRYISYAEQLILSGVEKQLFDSIKEMAK